MSIFAAGSRALAPNSTHVTHATARRTRKVRARCQMDLRLGTLGSNCPSGPIMRLGLRRAAPRVERVVDDHAVLQHFVIVRKIRREAERDREQAAALGTQIMT